ncbi:MAG: hypothetical protein ACI9UR_001404 [Bacteroidia bacterium]|jgi:hypothetical protein
MKNDFETKVTGLLAAGIVMLIPVNFEVYKPVLYEDCLAIGNGNFNTCKGR